jgi:NAD(P)H dehydrogenase (quinone)
VPYTEPVLSTTTTGGSPYGASHVTWNRKDDRLSDDDRTVARALGARVAAVALKLKGR